MTTIVNSPVGHQQELPVARRWLALAVLCISLLIVTLDNTVLNVVLPTLVRDLNATSTQLQWIVDSYVMVFAGLLLVAGSVADRIGRKRTFLAGLMLFAAGSTWAAFSGSVGMLIAARASMGIGGALIMPSTLSIITQMFADPGERQRAIGFWAGTSGLGIALGPIIGGLLLAHFWWGSVFLINVPIAVVGIVLAIPLVPDSKNPDAAAPDVPGALLSVTGLGLLLWSIIEAPVRGWTSALVIAAGAGGLVVLAAFTAWERHSSHPMLNVQFFRQRSFSAAISSIGLATLGLFGALFVLTQFLQFDLDYTPLQAAAGAASGWRDRGGGTAVRAAAARDRHQAHRCSRLVHHRRGAVADFDGNDDLHVSQHRAWHGHAGHRSRPGHPGLDRVGHGLRANRAHRYRIGY